MLQITIPKTELWDEVNQEFKYIEEQTLCLEHSLVSLSKWESKWCKPFLSKDKKTEEETLDYIKCMTITQNVDQNIYSFIPNNVREEIQEYIDAKMTATWFNDEQNRASNSEQITSELIYYWMITANIPFECENWHLNRLLTLIKVCNIKAQKPKKMGIKALLNRNAQLNAARRKQLSTKG